MASQGEGSRQQGGESQVLLCFLGLKACHPFQEKAIHLRLQPSKGRMLHSLLVAQFHVPLFQGEIKIAAMASAVSECSVSQGSWLSVHTAV